MSLYTLRSGDTIGHASKDQEVHGSLGGIG